MANERGDFAPDTVVEVSHMTVHRTRVRLAELAELSGEEVDDVIASFAGGAGREWLDGYFADDPDLSVLTGEVWNYAVMEPRMGGEG